VFIYNRGAFALVVASLTKLESIMVLIREVAFENNLLLSRIKCLTLHLRQ